MKFIVELGETSRKKIFCNSLADLKQNIEGKFLISLVNYTMQLYDKEEELYFDMDEEELEDGGRIKLVPKLTNISLPGASSTLNEDKSLADESGEGSNISNEINEELNDDASDEASATASKVNETLEGISEVVDRRPPWPITFNIPEQSFGASLKLALSSKQDLSQTYRTRLFQSIYDEAIQYYDGHNPEKSQYTLMTKALLDKYPYLVGNAPFTHALTHWKTMLRDVFRNNRKRIDRNSPSVKRNREKMLSKRRKKKTAENYVDASQNFWSIKNFLPLRCEGEDDISIAQHMEILQNQYKLIPNLRSKASIQVSMDKTFPERRSYILENGIKPVKEIKSTYPLLFTYEQVIAEFERLTGLNLVETFTDGVKKYAEKLVGLHPLKKELQILKLLREKIKSANVQSQKDYYLYCCALMVVTQQLRENVSDIFLYENDENEVSSFPKIIIEKDNPFAETSSFKVIVEGEILCKCQDMISAYAAQFATYYIFNLSYPDGLKSSLAFIQRIIFEFDDNTKKDPKVSKLVMRILA